MLLVFVLCCIGIAVIGYSYDSVEVVASMVSLSCTTLWFLAQAPAEDIYTKAYMKKLRKLRN